MTSSSFMTVAGLLYAFVGAGILCRVFFQLAGGAGQLFQGMTLANTAEGGERTAEQLMDAALAFPLLMVGFALQTLGQVSGSGLNWFGVVLALALAFGLLIYGLMKSDLMDALRGVRAPSRELPAPAVLLPTPEPRPEVVAVEELLPAAEVKTPGPSKQARQARAAR